MVLCCRRTKPALDDEEARKYTKQFAETKKILLLGTGESGKTTIIKQMKILHINGFSEEERKAKIPNIKQNIHESIYDIVNHMNKISPPVDTAEVISKKSIEFILAIGPNEPSEYTQEYFDHVRVAWADRGVKETFRRSNEYQLIDSAEHFLDRVDEICQPSYVPTTQDILFCRGGNAKFWMYDVGGQRGHRKRWIQAFDGIQAILFLMAASDFDQNLRECESKNRLKESFDLFKDVYQNRFVRDAGLIVFLNKQDLLKRKIIEQNRKLEKYFPEFAGYVPDKKDGWDERDEYDKARFFMKDKIMAIASTPVNIESVGFVPGYNINEDLPPREVYLHYTIATDTNNIKKVFESVQEMLLKNILEKAFSL
ncbi:guanine nucleotide-binding protein G(f) subunit alpha isoform X2 [Cylas formicarius]|uniref:guanine nucleotide-binding protein G(f) subunit alpha isoform X2 n=1 Tax=Cylas formicarius TaxID=197179 RepID=UPI00295860A6|nr:guanine nucleotide-binding protein G(f) subunit alpha isoform X2 [Cylas formicarius]